MLKKVLFAVAIAALPSLAVFYTARIVEQRATPEQVLADVTTEVQRLLPRG